ncbi:hypothetical protein [Streptomyces sp. 8N616]|uniref:hypothetical protein n=1 Tax=Streptomyces sp. 8N616 TaxID=3457414 RepID=UPI003FD24018
MYDAAKKLMADEPSPHNARAESQRHIQEVIRAAGMEDQATVGQGVAAAIATIQATAQEKGARDVDTVFKDPALKDLYTRPAHDEDAHRTIARAEYTYWQQQHAKDPSPATEAAVSFDVESRVRLQRNFGRLSEAAGTFTRAFEQQQTFAQPQNLAAGYTSSPAPGQSSSSAAAPPAAPESAAPAKGKGRK